MGHSVEEMQAEIDAAQKELESMRAILEAHQGALKDSVEINGELAEEIERLKGEKGEADGE